MPLTRLRSFRLAALASLLLAPAARAEEQPLRKIIDAEVQIVWQREKLAPAATAADAAFLRRIFLDLIGTIPTYEEATRFLQDADPNKRGKLIDRLLDDPRYAAHQADVWELVLFGRHPSNAELVRNRDAFRNWLTEKFAKNEPYDQWARELLRAEGNTLDHGPTLFYVQFYGKADATAEKVSRIFLGTQLQCARCHDHPFDKWKPLDFYGLAGFFARQVVVSAGSDKGKPRYLVAEKSTGEVLFSGKAADQKPGKKGEPVPARFLGGDVLEEPPVPQGFKEPALKAGPTAPKPLFSRKEKFADWATRPDNPYFAKAVANRVWAQFMGRGQADPVDDLRANRPASHPALFQAMHEQLVAHQFDLKWLVRELVNSETYQRSATGPNADSLPRWFERARVRPLSAEEIMAAVGTATGLNEALRLAGDKARNPLSDYREYFMRTFGSPMNGRGDFQASLTEHLFMNNSSQLRSIIQRRKGNLADALLASTDPLEKRVDRLFLSVLTRLPRAEERSRFVEFLNAGDPKTGAPIEDAIWVLLNTSEFRFNH